MSVAGTSLGNGSRGAILLRALAVIVASAVTAGCAPAPLTKADVDGRIVCDTDRMDQVERAARRENKEVHWLQCPQAVLRTM